LCPVVAAIPVGRGQAITREFRHPFRGEAVLGMARAAGTEPAEVLEVVEGDPRPVEDLVVGVHRPDAAEPNA